MNLNVTIYGVSPEGFKRMEEDMKPSHWLKEAFLNDEGLYVLFLEDYTILHKNSDKLWLDCGGHITDLIANEFTEITII